MLSLPWLARINSQVEAIAKRLTSDEFLAIDSFAIWFYLSCAAFFVIAVAGNLNGSSSGMYNSSLHQGAAVTYYVGYPRDIRSDEWAYATPDVLNQVLRTDRFAVETSDLGTHSIALTGNIPVKHFTEIFRPQFWAFFVLPVEYGFSFFWQAKALLLVGGVFTWLLLWTRSSLWSATGALWFLFSPGMQWTYSWPSALPEMIGLSCLATVCFCYLTIGRRVGPLLIAAAGAVGCLLDFALCSMCRI